MRAALLALALLPGCPESVPAPVPPTRLANTVAGDLQASGCSQADGGAWTLPATEQAAARFDRSPVWGCLYLPGGSVKLCGCP